LPGLPALSSLRPMSLRSRVPSLSLVLLLAGCGPEVPDDEVLLTHTDHYLTPEGALERSGEFEDVELLVPTDSGYTRRAVTSERPDRAQVRDVPEGPVLVRVGRTYVLTGKDERHLELGTYFAARPDTQLTQAELVHTPLNVTGLHPWNAEWVAGADVTDTLQVLSVGTDSQLTFGSVFAEQGSTTLVDPDAALFNTTSRQQRLLPRLTAERDSLVVTQLSVRSALSAAGADVRYSSVRKGLTLPAPTFTGAEPQLPLELALQDAPARTFQADLRGAAFASHAASVHPAAKLQYQALSIMPAAYGLAHGWVGESGALLTTGWEGLPLADVAVALEYGNPFPAGWGSVAFYQARYTIPSGTSGGSFSGFLQVVDAAERLEGSAVAPVVSPPCSVTLDGQPSAPGRTLANLAPVLAWEAPALGTPSHYQVSVSLLSYASSVVAVLRVPATTQELRLPDGILEPGRSYRFRVTAYVAPSWNERPLDYPFPHASADAVLDAVGTPGSAPPAP
jgi:hypothetical protein